MLPRSALRRLAPHSRTSSPAGAPVAAAHGARRRFATPSAFRVAVYPGDGIGKEVTAVTFRLLDQLQRRHGFALDCTWYDWGCDYFDKHGKVVPDDFLDVLRPYDAIFLGAVGFPSRVPDNVTLQPLIDMRQGFDQYVCLRPARTFPGVRTPLAAQPELDLFVIRENSEGEYVSSGGRFKRGTPDEIATQTAVHTRKGVERILRFALRSARERPRKRLCMATKSNAQKYSMVMWDDILDELRPEFQDVTVSREHIDAMAMKLVIAPQEFDVIVGSNLWGDIITDLTGAITGGLGLNPSCNLCPERTFPSLFEPVHGSAPDIAGRGIANPTAAMLSACMMLDWIGVDPSVAESVRAAVHACLECGERTPDLGGSLSSDDFAAAVLARLG